MTNQYPLNSGQLSLVGCSMASSTSGVTGGGGVEIKVDRIVHPGSSGLLRGLGE